MQRPSPLEAPEMIATQLRSRREGGEKDEVFLDTVNDILGVLCLERDWGKTSNLAAAFLVEAWARRNMLAVSDCCSVVKNTREARRTLTS